MNTWYVKPDSGGSGSGTIGDPWDGFADITWGVGGVVAGDTLVINAGTYSEMITITESGTSGSRITIDFASGAIIDATGVNYGISMTDIDYVTINDAVCHSATFSGINGLATCVGVILNNPTCYDNGANGIRYRDSQNVTINNPTCYSNTQDGILFDTTATGSPTGNSVIGGTLYSNGSEGVMVAGNEATPVEQENALLSGITSYENGAGLYAQVSDLITIKNCTCRDNTGAIAAGNERYGIAIYKSTNAIVQFNTVYGNSNHGIEANNACGGTRVEGNIVTDMAAGKYGINMNAASGAVIVVAGNVVVSNGASNVSIYLGASPTASLCGNNTTETTTGVSCVRFAAGASGWDVYNNIFTGKGTTTVDGVASATISNNCYFNTGVLATFNGTDYTSVDITTLDASAVAEDPQLDASYIPGNSNLYGDGLRWWTGSNPVGSDGEPFADWSPAIGAIQSKEIPFHPVNL